MNAKSAKQQIIGSLLLALFVLIFILVRARHLLFP
jgi:hypothetical protein